MNWKQKGKIILLTFGITLVAILPALVFAANQFPSVKNNWNPGDAIPSDWANSLENKIGVDGSTDSTTLDYKVTTSTNKHATDTLSAGTKIEIANTVINSSDQIGIGVSPSSALDVSGDVSITGNITSGTWQGDSIINTYIASSTEWNTAYDERGSQIDGSHLTWNTSVLDVDDDFLLNSGDTASGDYTFDTSTLYIDSTNDEVAIGTTSPSSKLDVLGTITATSYSGGSDSFSIAYDNPGVATGTEPTLQKTFSNAITLTKIECNVDTGTSTIQFDERSSGTPNTTGTDVLSSALTCDDTSTNSSTSFNNASITAGDPIKLDINSVSGSPALLRIHVYYEID